MLLTRDSRPTDYENGVILSPQMEIPTAPQAQDLSIPPQMPAGSIEAMAERYNLLPWETTRNACSMEAEMLLRRIARTPREPHPWIPVATMGPLLVFGHYNPGSTELWGVPEFLTIKTVITPEKYKHIHDDLIDRLRMNPVAPENAVEFLPPPRVGGSLLETFQWYTEHFPFSKQEGDRLAAQMSKTQTEFLETPDQFNEIERHLGIALYRMTSNDLVFNPEEAPPQTMFTDALLEKHGVYPLHCTKRRVHLLTGDPSNYSFEDEWLSLGNEAIPITMVVADKVAIKAAISKNRSRQSSGSAQSSIKTGELSFSDNAQMVEIDPQDVDRINPNNVNTTPEEIIHWILYRSVIGRASDLHIEKYYNMVRFRARIDGAMRVVYSSPDENLNRFVAIIKNYANMAPSRQEIQDARFSMILGKRRVDVRVAAVPHRKQSQKIIMRFLDKQDGLKNLKDLNLSERQSEIVEDVMGRDQGLVLVTGPTGSGKTTTLYALLNSVNNDEYNIQTIEDPIEYEVEGINQTQTDAHYGIDFPAGLRALLRADPDVILIGESRDHETANAAVNAALTGHLVLTTLHANDCIRAVSRLLSMNVPAYLLADSLAMTQAQRLVRRLCRYCKKPAVASSDFQRILARQGLINAPLTTPIYEANGCSECSESGYHGRIALMEMCLVKPKFADLIARGAPQSDMRNFASQSGVLTLYQEGLIQVMHGNTTLKEISPLCYTAAMVE